MHRRFAPLLLALTAALAPAAVAAPADAAGASQRAVVRGTLSKLPDETGGGRDRFAVTTRTGVTTLADPQPESLLGAAVVVRDRSPKPGIQGRARRTTSVAGARAALAGVTARPRSVAVIRFTFPGAADPAPLAAVDAVMDSGANSVDNYFRATSDGELQIKGLVDDTADPYPAAGDPYEVPRPASCGALPDQLAAAARLHAGPGIDAYDHVVIAFPQMADCGWDGLGQVPGRYTWINGRFATHPLITAHELGHNLGAPHASTLLCTGPGSVRVTISGTCETASTYGDPFDVMGQTYRLMSSWMRAQTGQLPTAARLTTSAGTHTLTDTSAPGTDGTRLLLVPRGNTNQWFAVEARGPRAPFDPWSLTDPVVTGLTIRLVPAFTRNASSTFLLDTTPTTSTYTDAPLQLGEEFADPVSGVTIRHAGRAGELATVVVGATPPPSALPEASPSPGGGQGGSGQGAGGAAPSVPGITPPATVPGVRTINGSIAMISPKLRIAGARVPSSRRLKFAAAGAAWSSVRIGKRTVKRSKTGAVTLRLTKGQRRRSTVTVVAGGGQFARSVKLVLRVRSGRISRVG